MCMDRNVLVVISPSHGILVFRDTLLECPPTDLAPFYSGIMWPYVVIAYTQGEQSGKGLGYVTPWSMCLLQLRSIMEQFLGLGVHL